MSNEDDVIRIRLEISVPSNGRSIQVDTGAAPDASPHRGLSAAVPWTQATEAMEPPPLSILGVVQPAANQPHPVQTNGGSGNSGVIYSQGNCVGISPTPDEVLLKCNAGTAVVANLDSSGNWSHDAVPGAVCSYDTNGLPANELLVTFRRNGQSIRSTTVGFYGQCVCATGCEAEQTATANRFLPTSYRVLVAGFSSALAHFNGQWLLQVSPCGVDDALVRWKAELPGAAGSIELVANPACGSAELVFRDAVHEVRYEKPEGSWHPMNVADFANCHSVVVPPGTAVPAIVQVELG